MIRALVSRKPDVWVLAGDRELTDIVRADRIIVYPPLKSLGAAAKSNLYTLTLERGVISECRTDVNQLD